ncbi:diguanylate cyclase, partial [Aerococcus sp. L_32]
MANITVFGKGNMGSAIGGLFQEAGNDVAYIGS